MSQTYPHKRVRLEGEDQARIQRLVEEVQGRLQELAAIGTRVLEIPLTSDITPKFVPIMSASGGHPDGLLIIPLPTDPPMDACLYYEDGRYTEIEVPCGKIPILT
jgi:hypothetical protein